MGVKKKLIEHDRQGNTVLQLTGFDSECVESASVCDHSKRGVQSGAFDWCYCVPYNKFLVKCT